MVIERKIEGGFTASPEAVNSDNSKEEIEKGSYTNRDELLDAVAKGNKPRFSSPEEAKSQGEFESENDLKKFCNEAWLELSGGKSEVSDHIYEKVVKELHDRYKDENSLKEYVQADARALLRNMI